MGYHGPQVECSCGWSNFDIRSRCRNCGRLLQTRWRHVTRDTEYTVIARDVPLQTTSFLGEGAKVTVYEGQHGSIWVRRQADFDDGRFERIGTAVVATPEALRTRIADLERQNADLQAANNRYLERARTAETVAAAARDEWQLDRIPRDAG